MMNKEEKLEKVLEELDDDKLVEIHNEFCESTNCYDDRIYHRWELAEYLYGRSVEEIIDAILDSNFDKNCEYWKDGIWGLESVECITDEIDMPQVIDWIIEYDKDFRVDEIREILDEEDEDDEESEETA